MNEQNELYPDDKSFAGLTSAEFESIAAARGWFEAALEFLKHRSSALIAFIATVIALMSLGKGFLDAQGSLTGSQVIGTLSIAGLITALCVVYIIWWTKHHGKIDEEPP